MKWRMMIATVVVVGLTVAGCSGSEGEGSVATKSGDDPLYSFSGDHESIFEDCIDTLKILQSNMTRVLEDPTAEMSDCNTASVRLFRKIEEMPPNDGSDPPFATIVRFTWLPLEGLFDDVDILAGYWQDCYDAIEQRLGCLDYVISESEFRKERYDRVLSNADLIIDNLNDLLGYVR